MIEWTGDEVEEACKAFAGVNPEGDTDLSRREVRAIMTRAVELAAARSVTMTAEDIAWVTAAVENRLIQHWMEHPDYDRSVEEPRRRARAALDKLTSQGATVATLQAKVEELEKAHDRTRQFLLDKEDECKALRAEVERLAAELRRMTELRDGYRKGGMLEHDRAEAAESRLAAIRERATQVNALGIRVAAEKAQRAHRDAAHRPWTAATDAAVSWVLEGDAPNSPEIPDSSKTATPDVRITAEEFEAMSDAPQEEKAVLHNVTAHGGMLVLSDRGVTDLEGNALGVNAPQEEKPEECLCGAIGGPERCVADRHPCSDTCTHDDAATPGHPGRVSGETVARIVIPTVRIAAPGKRLASDDDGGALASADPANADDGEPTKEEWEAAASLQDAYDRGAEAMRAACWEAVRTVLEVEGFTEGGPSGMYERFKAAIEGATP